ncbi:MAG: tetratricopeptide repeat protein [Wolinella sp.]
MAEDNVIRLDDDVDDFALDVKDDKPAAPLSKKEQILVQINVLREKIKSDKRWLYGAIGGGVVVFLLVAIIVLLLMLGGEESDSVPQAPSMDMTQQPILKNLTLENQPVDVSRLESMIKKASVLYEEGARGEALTLYESISNFSESLSNFNLGVAQAKEGNHKLAIESFKRAIDSGEDRAMSAVNAAISAYWLQNAPLYRYYVDLAEAYLPEAANLPLYPYLYALVQYYKGYYFEVISPLTHFQNTHYASEVDHLLAKLHLYYGDNQSALKFLERNARSSDYFDLGLLSARVGDYMSAQSYIMRHIETGDTSPRPYMAMALIDAKLGEMGNVASTLDRYAGDNEREIASIYPIKVRLKETLFDVHEAQSKFWSDFSSRHLIAYKIFFYYAPYKVFDAEQALVFIKQGGMNIVLNDIEEAKDVLVKGSTISKVNLNIARAIKETLQNNTREANRLLKSVVEEYPNHAILHYNLGLSYAQLGDFDSAYRHFLRSHHLNSRDILPGIFAIMCAKLTFRAYDRIEDIVASEIESGRLESDDRQFYLSLLGYTQGGQIADMEWLESVTMPKSIYFALEFALGAQLGSKERMLNAAKRLNEQVPNDLISSLLILLADHYGDDMKDLSLKAQSFYRENGFLEALYYGPALARELYIYVGYNIGTLRHTQQILDDKLISERREVRGITQALALSSIYLREFEKAFVLYNSLIDDMDERDSQTMFLAAVAAIGAGHHDNAVALLQLAKLEAPTNYESRYALGLLQQEAKNLKAAAIQFGTIGNIGFMSEFFDFDVDTTGYLP